MWYMDLPRGLRNGLSAWIVSIVHAFGGWAEYSMGIPLPLNSGDGPIRRVARPLDQVAGSVVAAWRGWAIFAIKLVHSVIFLSVAASVLHVFYAGITNRGSRLTAIALALSLGESLVFAANRFRCPLRGLAEELGAESGQVTDIFLPRWLADRISWIFTPLLVTGVAALLWHRWRCVRCD